MSLEKNIERIADALEAIARQKPASFLAAEAAVPAASEEAPKKEKTKPTPAPTAIEASAAPETTAPVKVTIEQLRAVGTALISAGKAEKMKEVLAKYKVEKLSALPENNYADVLAELQALNA